ncbi:hypothetical protein SAMD00019534_017640 [Acytostelium subglobosum LB1]|uniref:hypothetical protein n=1 Tax=Acytostelium subglobosum LB1 TaxID=1410327 RepID=UPI000644FA02|nr:hypothetical protein SAMD00019534_017640 [Acytostelium subglobosum LB1]GAM18589.1 hypothetical protein SAMD00019534_017640 [Acytostelium subglobosum LB1]|eukprot:XP_012757809.1 hypothetical protein SAMD00019534_017640 [Acytostelium subglobosum LB1]
MDDYHVMELIGEGSYGRVYKCRKKYTSLIYAIKCISKSGKQEKDIKSLRQEIDILKKLSHPNIIQLVDSFETSNEFCVITEYAQGDLYRIIKEDKILPEPFIQKVAAQILLALHYLHSNRIIHRDIKPQNILIGCDGAMKLCDFGFAKFIGGPSANTPMSTTIKGTPLYLAPEVVQETPYDNRADLWSFGIILYELYAGHPPWSSTNLYSLVQLIVNSSLKLPATLHPQSDFASLLQGLLAKDPEERLNWPDLLRHPFIAGALALPTSPINQSQPSSYRRNRRGGSGNGIPMPSSGSPLIISTEASLPSPDMFSISNTRSSPKIVPYLGMKPISVVDTSQQQQQQQPYQQQPYTSPTVQSVGAASPGKVTRPQTPQVMLNNNNPSIVVNPISTPTSRGQDKSRYTPSPSGMRPMTPVVVINRPPTPSKTNFSSYLPPNMAPMVIRSPPTTPSGVNLDRFDLESPVDNIDSTDYWQQQENKSANNEQGASMLRRDRLFLQKLLNHIQWAHSSHYADLLQPILLPILKTLSNILTHGKLNYRPPSGSAPPPLSPPSTPPSLPPTPASSSNVELLFKRTFFTAFVNLLSHLLIDLNNSVGPNCSTRINLQLQQDLLRECLGCLALLLQQSPPLATSQMVSVNYPSSPSSALIAFQFPPQSRKSSASSNHSSTSLLLSIFNHMTKNIEQFDRSNKCAIINLLSTFFRKIGESPTHLSDLYKRIMDNTDILRYVCNYFVQLVETNSLASLSISDVKLNNDDDTVFMSLLQCLVSFLFTSPTNIYEFPLGAYRVTSSMTPNQNTLIYQTACNIIGDTLAKEEMIHWLYDSLSMREDARYYILQLFLHCSRASSSFAELINREERSILAQLSPPNVDRAKHSLFYYLEYPLTLSTSSLAPTHTPATIQSLVLLSLGTILMQIPDTVEWIIRYSLETILSRYFVSADLVLSSCASYFIGSFLTESINIEKNDAIANMEQLTNAINTVSAVIPIKNIRKLFGSKRVEGSTLRDIEGGCMGRPYLGMLDGCACILLRLIKRNDQTFLEDLLESGVWETLCHQINNLTSEFELSPMGLVYCLRVVYEVLRKSSSHISYLVKNNLLVSLCSHLQPMHLDKLKEWPSIQSGGSNGLCSLVSQIIFILYLPDAKNNNNSSSAHQQQSNAPLFELIRHIMFEYELIKNMILLLPQLPMELVELPLGLLSTLILEDPQFAQQYVDNGGLEPQIIGLLLNTDRNPIVIIVDTLLILSQLARLSIDYHRLLHKSDFYFWLGRLLSHNDPSVRSKTCNLIGNLFKYNSYFYKPIQSSGVIPILIDRCSDIDSNTRKFACFAIGNAAFHSDELYRDLEPCIESLNMILSDEMEEEKTRSNVAGALGNLVRNSNYLCQHFINSDTMGIMLEQLGSRALTKNLLFSLGNFCAYEECRHSLATKYRVMDILSRLQVDQSSMKYLQRLKNTFN